MTKDRGKHTAVKLLIVINQFYKGGAETNLLNLLKALPETDNQVDLLVYDQMKLPNVISLLPQVPPHVTVCDAAGREDGNRFWHKALCRITRNKTKMKEFFLYQKKIKKLPKKLMLRKRKSKNLKHKNPLKK